MSPQKASDQPQQLLYLCDINSAFQDIPSFLEGEWHQVRLSERIDQNPDIHCSLEELHLLNEQKYDAIWLPQGLTTMVEKQLENFLLQVWRLLRKEGSFWFKAVNIKELSRLAYQTGWNDPIENMGLSPKELMYGSDQDKSVPNCRSVIKNGLTMKGIAEILQKAKFAKIEIIDQGLFFLVRATKLPMSADQKCQLGVQEYDINQRIAFRDQLDQQPQLPVTYSKHS